MPEELITMNRKQRDWLQWLHQAKRKQFTQAMAVKIMVAAMGCPGGLTIRIHRSFLDRVNWSTHARGTRLNGSQAEQGLPRSERRGRLTVLHCQPIVKRYHD
jgi:hypothetical protein